METIGDLDYSTQTRMQIFPYSRCMSSTILAPSFWNERDHIY